MQLNQVPTCKFILLLILIHEPCILYNFYYNQQMHLLVVIKIIKQIKYHPTVLIYRLSINTM